MMGQFSMYYISDNLRIAYSDGFFILFKRTEVGDWKSTNVPMSVIHFAAHSFCLIKDRLNSFTYDQDVEPIYTTVRDWKIVVTKTKQDNSEWVGFLHTEGANKVRVLNIHWNEYYQIAVNYNSVTGLLDLRNLPLLTTDSAGNVHSGTGHMAQSMPVTASLLHNDSFNPAFYVPPSSFSQFHQHQHQHQHQPHFSSLLPPVPSTTPTQSSNNLQMLSAVSNLSTLNTTTVSKKRKHKEVRKDLLNIEENSLSPKKRLSNPQQCFITSPPTCPATRMITFLCYHYLVIESEKEPIRSGTSFLSKNTADNSAYYFKKSMNYKDDQVVVISSSITLSELELITKVLKYLVFYEVKTIAKNTCLWCNIGDADEENHNGDHSCHIKSFSQYSEKALDKISPSRFMKACDHLKKYISFSLNIDEAHNFLKQVVPETLCKPNYDENHLVEFEDLRDF